MAYFVDPNGKLFEADPSEQKALEAQGFRAAGRDDLVKHNEGVEYEQKSLLGKAGDVAVSGLQGIARASMAPGMAIESAITGKPAISPRHPDSAFTESVFSPEAQARKERHPFTAGTGEAVPTILAGGALGGAAAGGALTLPTAGGILVGESALSGVSQEAVDSVTAKRDFSAKAALMNGGVDLALGTLTFGLAHGGPLSAARRRAAGSAEAGVPTRNLLAELDPGEVPEAIGAQRRARSAGAAGAANAPYQAPKARAADVAGDAANDVEPFADDVWEGAQKAWKQGQETASVDDARFLAEPANRDKLTELAAMNTADNLDIGRKVLRDDASLAAKNADIARFADEWTPEQVAAKRQWVDETVAGDAEKLLTHIDETRRAAGDVQAGRAGARAGGAGAVDAGGIDNAIGRTLRSGLDRVRRAEGAEQAIAIDGLKRSVGGLVGDIRTSRNIDDATKKERTKLLTDFYGTLQQGLEREELFGKLGPLQKSTNEAVTRLIEPWRMIEGKLSDRLDDTWSEVGQRAINRETQAAKVATVLRSGPLEQREFLRHLSDGLQAADDLIAARQAHGITDVADLQIAKRAFQEIRNDVQLGRVLGVAEAKAGQARPGFGEMLTDAAISGVAGRIPVVGGVAGRAGKEFLERFGKAPELPKAGPLGAALDNRLKAYSRLQDLQDPAISQRLPEWLQGALRGKGGQVAGVAAALGTGALLAPGEAGAAELLPDQQRARDDFSAQLAVMPPDQQATQIRTAEAFARIQRRTEQRVKGAVSDLFALAKNPRAKPAHRSPEARAIDARALELDVPRHMARFMGGHDDPVDAFRERAETIRKAAADPARLAASMAENLGDLPTQQPEIFATMVGHTAATVEYLSATMPGVAGKSALDPEGYPPTFEEISEWAARFVGAFHPLDSLDDLASNDLQPEQMEAVLALWPEGYAMFQTTAMGEIHELSRQKRPIPLEALEQIDGALDLDGAGEPTLSSAMADLIRQASAKEAERMQQQQAQSAQPAPMVSQSPSRLASSSLASLHAE